MLEYLPTPELFMTVNFLLISLSLAIWKKLVGLWCKGGDSGSLAPYEGQFEGFFVSFSGE